MGQVTVNGQPSEGIYAYDRFALRDKYSGLMQGNKGFMEIQSVTNRDHVEGRTSRILVIKDSYANCFAPFLALQYDEVWIADLRSLAKGLPEDVKETDFTDILVLYNFMNLASDNNFYRLSY